METDGEAGGLGASLESFKEVEEVVGIIDDLVNTIKDEQKHEVAVERFKLVLDWYQEQPHLLDPHLERLLELLVVQIRKEEAGAPLLHATATLAAHIFKVRGPKVVVRYLPHEVADLERVITVLQAQDPLDTGSWETRYILLLWLSIIAMIPFDIARFDSGQQDPMAVRLLGVTKTYLGARDKCRDAAAALASTFLTRPDTKSTLLPSFLEWAVQAMSAPNSLDGEITGALTALCAVMKHGKREDLMGDAPNILTSLLGANFKESSNTNIRKLNLKLVQRLGMIFLKSRVAAWRYQRGCRSLAATLGSNQEKEEQVAEEVDGEEDCSDVPESIEDVIEELLVGLKDKDTVVRWSAAKGIGRVTGRLPQDLADEVVGSLLELFSPRETDGAWHGGCLALAELGRRGLLLPQRLPEVVPHILAGLVYDQRKGNFSIGSHIRDAACYVCWAFARAYEPQVLAPYVQEIASALLTTSVFDREVNCRRAASAAFQENVGRQGTFPHGIDILTVADYFAVGSRPNAFLTLSVHIASHKEYTRPLIEHLLDRKVGHWDASVRELTAKALQNLCSCEPNFMVKEAMPRLLKDAVGRDLHLCHGATLAIGHLVAGIGGVAMVEQKKLSTILGSELISSLEGLVDNLVDGHKLRGLGGELMRQAVSQYILNLSASSLVLPRTILFSWLTVLEENLASSEVTVQAVATPALAPLLQQLLLSQGSLDIKGRDKVVDSYLVHITGAEVQRKGFSAALGALPAHILEGKEEEVILGLIAACKISEGTEAWAEARREAVKALAMVAATTMKKLDPRLVPHLYDCFLHSLEDYTIDRRGDTGAWVREAAMSALETLTLALLTQGSDKVPASIVTQVMPCLVQQAVEKIARTRGHAGKAFHTLLHAKNESGELVPGVPCRTALEEIFPQDLDVNWIVEAETFPLFVKLLRLPEYSERLILGLTVSVGGLTERLVKNASNSLFAEMRGMKSEEVELFASQLLSVFRRNQKVDRVTLPLFKFLDQLFTSGCLESVLENPSSQFSGNLFTLCKTEIAKSGDPNKLMHSGDVFCQLLQSADRGTIQRTLTQLSILLCHRFPRVRKATAEKLYEALLTFTERDIVPEDQLDNVMELLSETKWESGVAELRPVRNKICELAGVPVPTVARAEPH